MPIGKLMQFVRDSLSTPPEEGSERRAEAIRLATAVVLLDVAHADENMTESEEAQVVSHLRTTFELNEEMARELLEMAEEIRRQTIDHWQMTNTIRQEASVDDRTEIVRSMWRIVYADGHFHQYEAYLVSKLSDLMGIEHRRMIDLKMEIREELGLGSS